MIRKYSVRNDTFSTSGSIFAIRGDLDGSKDSSDYSKVVQFIGMLIGNEEFLLPIEVMNEIVMISSLTYVPRSPRYVEGVINLRGKIVPAINIRNMMGLPTQLPTQSSRIIIANFEDVTIGIIVDGITYVISLNPDQVEEHVLSSSGKQVELLKGISKRGEIVNGIIDISKVLFAVGYTKPDGSEQAENAA
ncbi:MAG: purine-binding chemotaxis protein CheW [Oligoflexales bacterium]|nr:purine-binding chemotaxis protein CheW [Oligoflexales bacterium]